MPPRFEFTVASAKDQPADLLVLPVLEGPAPGPGIKEAGQALGTDLIAVLNEHGVKGRLGDTLPVPTLGKMPAESLLLVGIGKEKEVTPDRIRRAAGKSAGRVARHRRVATTLPQAVGRGFDEAAEAVVEGLVLGTYRFDRYKADEEDGKPRLQTLSILGTGRHDARAARKAIDRGRVLAEAAAWTRDLVNTPATDATPAFLAQEARAMARKAGLWSKVWTKAELEKGGFGGILGVGRGSENDPRLIELRYDGGTGKPVALTGKGITFDSGGLSLKDAKGMEAMKQDMAGAATMMAAMRAVATLKPKVNVIAAIPSAENLPGGTAMRPGDVLSHRGGKTSEVLNTDAEGRLVLADALAYLAEKKPRCIVDAATLTGACMIALGDQIWGVVGNDRDVIQALLDVGEAAGEPGWELPLHRPYRTQLDSTVADVKNIGSRYGGAITAALFLAEFVGQVPWAHMDIAGVAFADQPGDYWPKGATGIPVRTVVGFVERQARPRR